MQEEKSAKLARTALLETFSLNAELFPAIVRAFAKQATGDEPSVPHAKVLLELLQMQLSQSATRKVNSDPATEAEPAEGAAPGLLQLFRETLDEITEKPDTQPKTTALP